MLETATLKLVADLDGSGCPVTTISFAPGGILAVGFMDGSISLLDPAKQYATVYTIRV